jgi:hypothetical protein
VLALYDGTMVDDDTPQTQTESEGGGQPPRKTAVGAGELGDSDDIVVDEELMLALRSARKLRALYQRAYLVSALTVWSPRRTVVCRELRNQVARFKRLEIINREIPRSIPTYADFAAIRAEWKPVGPNPRAIECPFEDIETIRKRYMRLKAEAEVLLEEATALM